MSRFPLKKVTQSQLLRLGEILWSWPLCENCCNGAACVTDGCPSQRSKRLLRYFQYYRDLTASYEPVVGVDEEPALSSHEDLFQIITEMKSNPDLDRSNLTAKVFASRPGRKLPPANDQNRAIDLAVRVMVMVNSSSQRRSSGLLESGTYRTPWTADVPFSQFISNIFPMTNHPSLNDDDLKPLPDIKSALMARKLRKHIDLKFRPTDDLRKHLRLDHKNNVLELYHHTAFLKEHLRATKPTENKLASLSVSDSLKLGALPRQLALETLDSIQKILFPLGDGKSRSLLLSLTTTGSFDPDALRFESTTIRNTDETDIAYYYLGANLAGLYDVLENPRPRGLLEKWLERKSGARYVMMATLAGVAIAILLGMASLAVSGYQAWVGYQQWKHPTSK